MAKPICQPIQWSKDHKTCDREDIPSDDDLQSLSNACNAMSQMASIGILLEPFPEFTWCASSVNGSSQ
jgi:hypothetical protein